MSIYEPSTSPAETQSIGDRPNSLTRRKRILRTYGRRSREQQEQEPFAKKRKVKQDDDVPATLNTDRQSIQRPPAPPSNPIEEADPIKKSTKRGSILAYFKPCRIALSSDHPSISDGFPSSDPVERPPSPPASSPPRRTRRRLTTKPTTQVVTSVDEKEEKDSSTIIVKGDETALNEVPLNTAYAQSEDRRPLVRNAEEKKKRSPKQSKELVQTVLSLSINKEPGFVICKECGILYNPLNGEDRKEHRKRHGAWVRAKGKAEEQGEAEV